jgi:hypothetical protein
VLDSLSTPPRTSIRHAMRAGKGMLSKKHPEPRCKTPREAIERLRRRSDDLTVPSSGWSTSIPAWRLVCSGFSGPGVMVPAGMLSGCPDCMAQMVGGGGGSVDRRGVLVRR